MTLGEKIAMLRTKHHLSQGDLAEKLGISRQSISKWETGSSVPDLDKLILLSDLFDISLDTLVKEQEPKEGTDSQPFTPQQSPEKYPPRKIAGWILLSVALLSVVFGVVFYNPALAILGGYLLLCGIICQTVKKHPGLVIGWGTFLPSSFLLPRFTSANMGMIFHPYVYQRRLGIQLIVSYAFWALLLLLIFITIKKTGIKKHPFIFLGWAVFSQVYGFIPIAFQHSAETMKSYLMLSWCVILLLIMLVFFTGKFLYRCFQTRKLK